MERDWGEGADDVVFAIPNPFSCVLKKIYNADCVIYIERRPFGRKAH